MSNYRSVVPFFVKRTEPVIKSSMTDYINYVKKRVYEELKGGIVSSATGVLRRTSSV